MSVPDRSIDPKIIESARAEFLDKGFEKASLTTICKNAGVTTGALYKRYKGKEDLFCSVVSDLIRDLDAYVEEKTSITPESLIDEELLHMWDMDEESNLWWFRFLYERRDNFILLFTRADGTIYSNYKHDWVQKMTDQTYLFLEEIYKRELVDSIISPKELHVLQSAYWETICEPVIHGFTWEQIEAHCKRLCKFLNWKNALGF